MFSLETLSSSNDRLNYYKIKAETTLMEPEILDSSMKALISQFSTRRGLGEKAWDVVHVPKLEFQ